MRMTFIAVFVASTPSPIGNRFAAEHVEDKYCDYKNVRVAEPIVNRQHAQIITEEKFGKGTVMTREHAIQNCLDACTELRYNEAYHRVGKDTTWSQNLLGESDKVHGFFLFNGEENSEWAGRCACISQDPLVTSSQPNVSCNNKWSSYRIRGDTVDDSQLYSTQRRRLSDLSDNATTNSETRTDNFVCSRNAVGCNSVNDASSCTESGYFDTCCTFNNSKTFYDGTNNRRTMDLCHDKVCEENQYVQDETCHACQVGKNK